MPTPAVKVHDRISGLHLCCPHLDSLHVISSSSNHRLRSSQRRRRSRQWLYSSRRPWRRSSWQRHRSCTDSWTVQRWVLGWASLSRFAFSVQVGKGLGHQTDGQLCSSQCWEDSLYFIRYSLLSIKYRAIGQSHTKLDGQMRLTDWKLYKEQANTCNQQINRTNLETLANTAELVSQVHRR